MRKTGRKRRALSARTIISRVTTGSRAPVEQRTTSARSSRLGSSARLTATPETSRAISSARALLRFATSMSLAEFWCSSRAASCAISPAPMRSTVRPERLPSTLRASWTATLATDTAPRAICVSVRTRFAADCALAISRPREAPAARGRLPGAGGAVPPRELVLLFHLPEDLRLADDHGIEARRHAEEMGERVVLAAHHG